MLREYRTQSASAEPNPITVGDVARRLKLSPDRVRQLEKAGELHAKRTESGIRLFDPAEVARFAAEREKK